MSSGRDYTKYKFNNNIYGKSRLVQAVVKKFVDDNPDITFDKLKEIFPDTLQSNSKIQFSSIQVVFSKFHEIPDSELKRFFHNDDEILSLADCEILVSNQWNRENIQNFINAAVELGYLIEIAR